MKHAWTGQLTEVADPKWLVRREGQLVVLSLLDGDETQAQLNLSPNDTLLLAQHLIARAQEETG